MLQNFLQITWWTEYTKSNKYLNYINWWYKSKYSSSPNDILKSPIKPKKSKQKKTKENKKSSTPRRQLPKLQLVTTEFLLKFLAERKYLVEL